MKFFNMICFAVSLLMLSAACGKFDDSALWNDVDHAYNQLDTIKLKLEEMTAQADMLSAVVNGGAITWISPAEDGGYTVRYKGQDNVENTIVIAGKENVSVLGDAAVSISKLTNLTGAMSVGKEGKTGFLGVTDWSDASNSGKITATNGVVTLGGSGELGREVYNGKNAVYVAGDVDVQNITVTANSEASGKGIFIGQNAELIADAAADTNVTGSAAIEENGTLP